MPQLNMNSHSPVVNVKQFDKMEFRLDHVNTDEDDSDVEECMQRRIPKIYKRLEKISPELQNKKSRHYMDFVPSEPMLSIHDQYKIHENILKLQNQIGMEIIQKNGQRKLGGPPPGWQGPVPGPGCEIFVGKIPRDIYEDEIYPLFRKIGEIYEMRLMMNFSGTNRGFCFIMYANPELAQRAIKELNNYPIRQNWFLGVVESVNNCRLHVTDLPSRIDAKTIIKKIWPVCEDLDKVYVFTSFNHSHSKHALITFKTHRSAAMARRRLLPERHRFFEKVDVRIEWAYPNIAVSNVQILD
ncbi:RNA-binding protein 47-like [Trichogramma pretiosum]|uniref:RNA-binding protein 47-like n=1 Tax=Trichogramma pretiosum TaxID=7493 RepID=UPI0006C9A35D|nr:RNA-binding protein 47-like [Trichogramma pretiosum]